MRRYLGILIVLVLLALIWQQTVGFGGRDSSDLPSDEVESSENTPSFADSVQASLQAGLDPGMPSTRWEEVVIGKGESFYVALQRAGLDHQTIMRVVEACRPHTNLRSVREGNVFALATADSGSFAGLRFDLDAESYLELEESGDHELSVTLSRHPLERVVKGVSGEIESSLFVALKNAGADPGLAGQFADILGWDIDFFRDLRQGDRFRLVYEEFLHEGKKVREGQILAATFENRGESYQAFLFENHLGLPAYYDEEGNSLEKQFLRAPLKFRRISSGFSKRRLHPVLKSYRPHYGVDYAAPTGTPVMATANGVVIARTRKSGNGNYVGLRHGQSYESYYLHLSRFAKDLKIGQKVQQGTVIGYVGETGWATAPHLDYRIKKNGKWVDPRKLKLPPASPVAAEAREAYAQRQNELGDMLARVPEIPSVLVLESAEFAPREDVEVPTEGGSATGR